MRTFPRRVLPILVFFLSLQAQTPTTGQITGLVLDPSGAVVRSAKVAAGDASGLRRETVTDETGGYVLALLPPGEYAVEASASGFKTARFGDVPVRITETARVDFPLEVADAATDVITVMSEGALLQTTNPTTGRAVATRSLSELPLATRNFTQILGLSPGTATYLPDNTSVGRNSQNISVNGARVTQNNFMINGVDANSIGTNSSPSLSIPAPESLQEFKVQTSLYDASFGRSGGGSVQAITKSGSNQAHGNAYEYFRNDALNANNPFLEAAAVDRPALRRNVFGGTVGGPVRRDRAFFFGSYQGTRETNGASLINSVSSNILVAPGLTNDRSESTLLAGFRPSILGAPVARVNPTALALLNFKLPNGQYLIPTPQAGGRYTGSMPSTYREDQFNANFDYRFSAKNSLAFKFFFMNAPQTLTLPSFLGGGPNVPGFGNDQKNTGRIVTLQDTHIISPRMLNEFRFGYSFLRVDAYPQEPVNDADIGIKRANAGTFPGLGLIQIAPTAGGVVIGTSPTIDVQASGPSATMGDTVSMVRGKHMFRAGGEVRYSGNNSALNFFTRGQIQFLSFNDFLTGSPLVTVFGSGIGNRSLRVTDYNFFAQDDWKVSRRLTLNLGFRYELDLPPTDTRGRMATFDPGLYRPSGTPPSIGYVQAGNVLPQYEFPGVPKVGNAVVKSVDPNNFAPRFGFAYSPRADGSLALRGGYGIFYSRTSLQYVALSIIAPPMYVFGARVAPPFSDPFFPAPPQSAFPTLVPGVALSGTLFDRNLRTPYIQQAAFGAQYQLAGSLLLEAGYVGTRGVNLFRQIAINQAPLASESRPIFNALLNQTITATTPANAALRAPFQGVSVNGFFQNQSTAQSVYHSLQASVSKRMSHGLQFLASYTFAKSIDNASGQGGGAGSGGVLNPGAVGETSGIIGNQLDNRANRGLSDFDRAHRFVFSGLWEVPKPTTASGILGGWQFAAIVTAMSGLPIDIVDSGAGSFYGLSGAASSLARPSLAPGATVATAKAAPDGFYFNPAAFVRPIVAAGVPIPSSGGAVIAGAAGTDLGDVGRNILRGPSQSNVDVSVTRRFFQREGRSVELRGEFFNAFNTVNLANPISDLNSVAGSGGTLDAAGKIVNPGSFGKVISTTNNPRLIQLVLKLNF